MTDFLARLLDTSDFPPRWQCGAWTQGHGWLHVLSDLGVWGAYLAIPLVLGSFVLRRRDVPFRGVFALFGAFILACGTTHLLEAVIFWWPAYRLAGVVKLATAAVSWATVVALARVAPRALAMRSPEALEREVAERTAELVRANDALGREVGQRAQAEAALLEADRRKDEFLALLGHELRNPLAPVRNAVGVLRVAGPADPQLDWARSVIDRQVGHMARLVDDLLDVSRVARGMVHLRTERVDLSQLARTAAADRRPAFDRAGIALAVTVPDDPVWARGDPTRLAQVVGNLLDNAAKYTPSGGRVELTLAVDEGARRANVRVRDTGVGIDPAFLPRVFEPFEQGDRSLDRSQGGLGLGLALVKGLVGLHGGEAEAHSDGPGRGAEFVVRLPLDETSDAPAAAPACPALGPGRRVLVVEDNRDCADSLRVLLELMGHEAAVAYTGPDGVRAAKEWAPDAVLCDLGLPGLDGFAVARQLRSDPSTARALLVAVTGYAAEDDRRKAAAAGFDHLVAKPADPADLSRLLTGG